MSGGRKKSTTFRPVSSTFRPISSNFVQISSIFVRFRPVDEKGNFWWTKISSKKFVRWTKNHQNTLKISSTFSSTQRQNFVHLRETFALQTAKRHGKAQNTLSCAVVVEPPTQRKQLYINDFGHKIIVRLHCIKITERLWQSTDIWIQFVHPGRYIRTRERNIRTTFALDLRETYALHSHYIRTRGQKKET